MNLLQLKSLCEIVDRGLKLSDAATALYRSQSAVTRQIQELEKELEVQIFQRRKNKILQITDEGKEVVEVARKILRDAEQLYKVKTNLQARSVASLGIATTHTQARYLLPPMVRDFARKFPNVQLTLTHASPQGCYDRLLSHEVDMAICSGMPDKREGLIEIPCYRLTRSVVVPPGHPLLEEHPLTLEAIARYPIIHYEERRMGRTIVADALAGLGVKPAIQLSALDIDVSKRYVEMGMGIAILTTVAFDKSRDSNLVQIDASNIFPPSVVNVMVRQDHYLPAFVADFVGMLATHLSPAEIGDYLLGLPVKAIKPLHSY